MIGETFFKQEVQRTLENLSAGAEAQARYLEGLGVSPMADELALEFDGVAGRMDHAVEEGFVSPKTAAAVKELDLMLQKMSGGEHAHLWTTDALQSAPEWERIRRHARSALDSYLEDQIPRSE